MNRALLLALWLGVTGATVSAALAEDRPGKAQKLRKKRAKAARPPRPSRKAPRAAPVREERAAQAAPANKDAVAAAQAAAGNTNAQIVKEGDTSVKVMSFEGLGIEGRLKSPQLVYFVQRVQAEFERPNLPHRSFIPELSDSTRREPVR